MDDRAWRRLERVLVERLDRRGSPAKLPLREFLEAILYIDRTGLPWRDLPACFGKWDAAYQRFRRWERAGHWAALARELAAQPARDSSKLFIDSTVVRAHQHAAGGTDGPSSRAKGRSRGGWGTKIHLVAVDERTPIAVTLTGGQANDCPLLDRLMLALPEDTGADTAVADRAYDSDANRARLAAAGFKVVIPARRNRRDPPPHDEVVYAERERVERAVGRLKRMRRVATRYEKLDRCFLAMVHLSCYAAIAL